jgi:ribosome maturation factor RimP
MQESDTLFKRLEPQLAEAGLALVELAVGRRGGSALVRMTVYSAGGTGTDECAKAHRIAYPAAQEVLGHPDPELEVSSPGIDRALKSAREWAVFKGRGVKVLLRDETEWIRGRIEGSDEISASLACKDGSRVIEFGSMAKARLDSSQGGD